MTQHLNLTKGEVVARLQSKWEDDVEAFDQIFTEILTVADVLADGVIKQFPEKFGGPADQTATVDRPSVHETRGEGGPLPVG